MHSKNQRTHGSPMVPVRIKAPPAPGSVSPSQPRPFRMASDSAHGPFVRAPQAVYPPKGARGRPCVSVPVVSLEKMPCLGRNEGAHVRLNCTSATPSSSSSTSSSSAAATLKPARKPPDRVPNGRIPSMPLPAPDKRPGASPSALERRPASSPSPSSSSLDRRPNAPPTLLDKKQQNGTKGSKPYKRMSGRVFDANKHCGVQDPESKRPCTRSLTCKTHSLTHRRAVLGRKKLFDSLLAEHKGRLKEKEAQSAREQQQGRDPAHGLPVQSHDPLSSPATNGKTPSPSKARPIGANVPRTPGGRGGVSQNRCPGTAPVTGPLGLGAEGSGQLSSDEDEGAPPNESERPDCPCSPRHPRPLGCCSFGGRLMGRGNYVFDRRWDRTRLALYRMVERHVNSLMWRKIPQADENLTTSPGPISATQAFLTPSSSSTHGIGLPLLSPPAALVTQSEGFSMVSYSTAFPPSGGGVFSIVDSSSLVAPFPAPSAVSSQRPRAKPSRSAKAPLSTAGALAVAGGGVAGGADGRPIGGKKKPPLSYVAPRRRNAVGTVPPLNSLPIPPALCSNGGPPLSAKTELPAHDTDFTVPRPLSRDHAQLVHSPLPFSAAYGRKRKSCDASASISKTTKASGLSSIFRKGALEPPHTSLPRQVNPNFA